MQRSELEVVKRQERERRKGGERDMYMRPNETFLAYTGVPCSLPPWQETLILPWPVGHGGDQRLVGRCVLSETPGPALGY